MELMETIDFLIFNNYCLAVKGGSISSVPLNHDKN